MDKKVERIINLYNRLYDGELLVKSEEAERFGVNERSIQRDIEDLRDYLADDPSEERTIIQLPSLLLKSYAVSAISSCAAIVKMFS